MCPPNYHHNGFMATHAQTMHHVLMFLSCHKAIAIVVITGRAHCFHDALIN